MEAYIGSSLLPDFAPLVLGSESEGCADDSSNYDDALLDPLGEIDNPRFLALYQVYHTFCCYQYEDECDHEDHDLEEQPLRLVKPCALVLHQLICILNVFDAYQHNYIHPKRH